MLSTYCGQRGIPPCHRCNGERCACECHAAIPAQNKADGRAMDGGGWDNGGTNKDGPAGAQTPVTPGLTDHEGIG